MKAMLHTLLINIGTHGSLIWQQTISKTCIGHDICTMLLVLAAVTLHKYYISRNDRKFYKTNMRRYKFSTERDQQALCHLTNRL